jgi:hypothetical protein
MRFAERPSETASADDFVLLAAFRVLPQRGWLGLWPALRAHQYEESEPPPPNDPPPLS